MPSGIPSAAFRLVHGHERGLAHCGERLDFGEVARTTVEPGGPHAHADRAGGHEDDLTAGFAERVDLRDEAGDGRLVGEEARPDFQDHAAAGFQDLFSGLDGVKHDGSFHKEVAAGELGVAGEVYAELAESGGVALRGEVREVHFAAVEPGEMVERELRGGVGGGADREGDQGKALCRTARSDLTNQEPYRLSRW